MPDQCFFSTDIAENLTCCLDELFDHNGFPINRCPKYPCERYLKIQMELDELEKERREKQNA